ncbi:MAG: endonuclease/exonuclease/phosphatase family protein [Gammaproteobacteria bacterium]|nr:MAG: endonuclease/exonuclease/phosphatase family protein [Gammaproteobacteria bacterium]
MGLVLFRAAVFSLVVLTVSCQARDVIKISEFPEQQRAVPESITIVNWNAQKGANSQFKSDLSRLVIASRPDFVFLQEARADLLETKRIGGYFASSWSYPWRNGKTIGLLTLSYVPPVRIQPVPSKYKEFFITAPKLSLVTEYPLANGQRLLAINVHLLAFERWSTVGIRSQLDDLEAVMREHDGPIVLVGDFNTWSQKRLDLVQEVVDALNLTEVTDFPAGRRTGDKQTSFLNWLFGIDKQLPLDRVFYRGFTDHSAKVLPYDSSDHRAIQVTLVLDTRRPAPAN